MIKEYRVISEFDPRKQEEAINRAAIEGYALVLACQSESTLRGGQEHLTIFTAYMVKEEPAP